MSAEQAPVGCTGEDDFFPFDWKFQTEKPSTAEKPASAPQTADDSEKSGGADVREDGEKR